MEGEIRCEPLRLRGHDASGGVAEEEGGGGWSALLVEHPQGHAPRRKAVEEDRDLAAKTEILGALTDIQHEGRLAFPGVARIELHDAILELQSAQGRQKRLALEPLHVEPEIGVLPEGTLVALGAEDLAEVRSRGPQRRGGSRLVVDF